ncbi:MAG: cobalamin-dependent protein [Clostridiales Family XIII bacterium]|jgi:radical SAM superfamily enzyme YgiQ (UPF0313 family)|nr:cobalamin-dependent protein [Clostridiales Family XIII bacterium]
MIENVTDAFLNSIKAPRPDGNALNCLLVVPRMAESDRAAYLFPTGLAYISSAVKASGRNLHVLNLNYKNDCYALLRSTIIDRDIRVIMTGGLSAQYKELKTILDVSKSVNSEIIAIIGGGIVTAEPGVAMQALENADFGVIGEGETAINELLYALENNEDALNVPGVIGNGFCNSPARAIDDLDILPFPDYVGLNYYEIQSKENSLLNADMRSPSLILSRSCPFCCTFCFHSSGVKYRRRSIDNVFKEIDWLIKTFAIDSLMINDELFCDKSDYVLEFCERMKPYNIKYWAQTRVDTVNKQKLQAIKDSGCDILCMGIESADNDILKSMKKNITVKQIEMAYDSAIEVGLVPTGNIILGDLAETAQTYRNSLDWLRRNPQYSVSVFGLLTFPGSHVYRVACERGVIKDRVKYLRDGNFQINITNMTDEEYRKMFDEADLFNIVYRSTSNFDEGNFRRNFALLLEGHKVALWPATSSNINFLLQTAPDMVYHDNFWLINANPNGRYFNSGDRLNGSKSIKTPDVIAEKSIDVVVWLFREEAFGNLYDVIKRDYPMVRSVVKLADLAEKDFSQLTALLNEWE